MSSKIQNGRNNSGIFKETRLVLELLEESKERVSSLKGTLRQLEDNRKHLDNLRLELETSILKNTHLIQSNDDFKTCMKNCNESFLRVAQEAYNQCKTLSADLNLCNDKHDHILKSLNDTGNKLSSEQMDFESKKNSYSEQLSELDRKAHTIENIVLEKTKKQSDLKIMLDNLKREIVVEEQTIADKNFSREQMSRQREDLKDAENKYYVAADAIRALEEDKDKKESSLKAIIEDINQQVIKLEEEISQLNYEANVRSLEECRSKKEELYLSISKLGHNLVDLAKEKESVNLSISDDKMANEIKMEEMKIVMEDRTRASAYQLDITAEVLADLGNQESKLRDLEEEIINLSKYIAAIKEKPKVDLEEEINTKKGLLCEIKINRGKLKQNISIKQTNIAIESTALKKTIGDLQLELNKPQQEYDEGELLVKKLTSRKGELSQEITNKQNILKEWVQKLDNMKKELTIVKGKATAKKQILLDFPQAPKRNAPKATSLVNAKQVKGNSGTTKDTSIKSFWDSDSSIDAIDLASKLRRKKIRKLDHSKK